MSGNTDQSAWGDFWQLRRGDSGFPRKPLQRIEAVQQRCWEDFARSLPGAARVLDLGTGSGIVLATIQRIRPDLDLIGIDSAPALPPAPQGILLRPGLKMERLPFANASFAVVTSQFAFEYGDTAVIAKEVGRVLARHGQLQMLMHHARSPIVAYHRDRHAALRWAVAASSSLRATMHSARRQVPAALRATVVEARRRYADQPVAAEFVTAIQQTLELGREHSPERVLEVLDVLEHRAASELARLESLMNAACDAPRIERIGAELEKAECETAAVQTLSEADRAAPFGWLLQARRR